MPRSALSSVHRHVLAQIVRAIGNRNIGEVFDGKSGRPTHQAWNKWEKGASPRLSSLEAVAERLDRSLVVDLRAMSGERVTDSNQTTGEDTDLTDDLLQLFRDVDALPPDQRARVMGRIEGMLTEMRARPTEPAEDRRARHGRSS